MFDIEKFVTAYQQTFPKEKLKPSQVDGIHSLLINLSRDLGTELVNNIEQAAYFLATVKHETANTYQPIREYGRGIGHTYGKKDPATGQAYYGRGYVQLTWKRNYASLGDILNLDLVNNPDLALDPDNAYKILITGMDRGLFGRDIDDCITGKIVDFVLARRTVNGTDRAALISGYAYAFLDILRRS